MSLALPSCTPWHRAQVHGPGVAREQGLLGGRTFPSTLPSAAGPGPGVRRRILPAELGPAGEMSRHPIPSRNEQQGDAARDPEEVNPSAGKQARKRETVTEPDEKVGRGKSGEEKQKVTPPPTFRN